MVNPRTDYPIEPMDLANMRQNGDRSLEVACFGCRHEVIANVDKYPGDLLVKEFGPRTLDPSGMPTHADNQSIVKERISFDKDNPQLLIDEITLIDHAFTRPWKVVKPYRRNAAKYPNWLEYDCIGDNGLIKIGNETYYKSSEGRLMPTRVGQPPPDLRYFKQVKN